MPYITKDRRDVLQDWEPPEVAGELNYLITKLCIEYLSYKGEKYATYNDIIGALECAKLEMYRRKISPYENKKIEENGDVYPICSCGSSSGHSQDKITIICDNCGRTRYAPTKNH